MAPQVGSLAQSAIALVGIFAITFGAAAVGGLASVRAASFYASLDQPSWSPPASLFGPVWTVLYTLMAIAAYLVVGAVGWKAAALPLAVYVGQLALNALGTWLFFAWKRGGAAFIEIVVLVLLIVVNIVLFWHISPLAGALLIPYVAWVSFATLLTWTLWRANRGIL